MEDNQRVEYPCTKCKKQQPCSYKDCQAYMAWFSQEWKAIRNTARVLKEKRNG